MIKMIFGLADGFLLIEDFKIFVHPGKHMEKAPKKLL
jgi:hypothetical protein